MRVFVCVCAYWRIRVMSLEELPDEILRNIIIRTELSGWMNSLRTSTRIRRIARTIHPSIFGYDRAKIMVDYIREDPLAKWAWDDMEDFLLLTYEQVQRVAYRVGLPPVIVFPFFNRDSMMQLIELHGGEQGLALRIAGNRIQRMQEQQARDDADPRSAARRKQALEERMEKVRAIPSPQHNHHDKDLLLTHAHVHAHKQIVFALFLCTETAFNSSKATSRYC